MTKDEISLLTLKTYSVVRSSLTGQPYLDKSLRCYIFEAEREAAQFCEQVENLTYDPPTFLKQGPFISLCYGLGVTCIRVKLANEEKYKDIVIAPSDARLQYYNRIVMSALLRLKQTQKKKYLRAIGSQSFIVPVVMDERKHQHFPSLHYGYAELGDGAIYYLLFVTLEDFEQWNETQNNQFHPLEITLSKYNRIRKNFPVLINPLSDRVVLTNEQIVDITKS